MATILIDIFSCIAFLPPSYLGESDQFDLAFSTLFDLVLTDIIFRNQLKYLNILLSLLLLPLESKDINYNILRIFLLFDLVLFVQEIFLHLISNNKSLFWFEQIFRE